ncbi:hypothetical protein FACS1894109_15700 [Spirochaetia bacterium]|nr:hypothetical protein FACS1894109_15700 [Spirochaetia bacterium]
MRFGKLLNVLIIQVLARLMVVGTTLIGTAGITLGVMMAVVTVVTIFNLRVEYKPITALVALAALVVLTIVNVVFNRRNRPVKDDLEAVPGN